MTREVHLSSLSPVVDVPCPGPLHFLTLLIKPSPWPTCLSSCPCTWCFRFGPYGCMFLLCMFWCVARSLHHMYLPFITPTVFLISVVRRYWPGIIMESTTGYIFTPCVRYFTSPGIDNIDGGFQHCPRPFPLEVNHCCSCRLHALVARALVKWSGIDTIHRRDQRCLVFLWQSGVKKIAKVSKRRQSDSNPRPL